MRLPELFNLAEKGGSFQVVTAGAKNFSCNLCVQTGSGAQPPVQWVPGVLSPGVNRGRGVMLTTHPPPSSAEVDNE
jgi:hypothetical protein